MFENEPDVVRIKIRHYRQLYGDKPDPIIYLPVAVNASGCVYADFVRLIFLYVHRETSILAGELPFSVFFSCMRIVRLVF